MLAVQKNTKDSQGPNQAGRSEHMSVSITQEFTQINDVRSLLSELDSLTRIQLEGISREKKCISL